MSKIILLEKGNYSYGLLTEQDAGVITAEMNPRFMKEGHSLASLSDNGMFTVEVNCILQKADTETSIVAASHGGTGRVVAFLKSNGRRDPRDGNGTPISHYFKKFETTNVNFDKALIIL